MIATQRVARRAGHYMPVVLLHSQVATLEPPDANEWHLDLNGDDPDQAKVVVDYIRRCLERAKDIGYLRGGSRHPS
jgi:gluconate kinase